MLQFLLMPKWLLQKHGLIVFLMSTLFSLQAFAQDDGQLRREALAGLDTANLKKMEFKISRVSYLENYGFSDTAKAVINLYFTKRMGARITSYANLGFLSFIRVAGQEQPSPFDPTPKVTYKPWVVPALVIAGSVTIFSFFRLDAWNLKSLVKTLYVYEKTGILPIKLQKKLNPAHFRNP